jgi:hypothetical protein
VKGIGNLKGAIATDRNQGIEPAIAEGPDEFLGTIHDLYGAVSVGFRPCEGAPAIHRSEDRPAQVGNPLDGCRIETYDSIPIEKTLITSLNPVDFPALVDPG